MRSLITGLLEALRRLGARPPRQVDVGGTVRPTGRLEAMVFRAPQQASSEQTAVREGVVAVRRTDEEVTALRIADSEGQSLAANVRADGTVDYWIRGKSRQNEEGVLDVCRILVDRLRLDGANWGALESVGALGARAEKGVDCQARDGAEVLAIQVVRAEIEGQVWGSLARTGESSRHLTAEQAADAIRGAIAKKAERFAIRDRSGLTLALDATETASHAFHPVIRVFLERHGGWVRALQFAGVWLVGPNVTLTSRLDMDR